LQTAVVVIAFFLFFVFPQMIAADNIIYSNNLHLQAVCEVACATAMRISNKLKLKLKDGFL